MTDARVRQLEREVEQTGDSGSRFALTRELLRKQTGVVAFWHGEERPHPSACKVSIGFDVLDPVTQKVLARPNVVGWMLGIVSPADLLDIAVLRSGVRLLDLETWRAVGIFGEAEAVWPQGRLEPAVATLDAFGRHRNTKVGAGVEPSDGWTESFNAGSYLPSVGWAARPSLDEAIYDRDILSVPSSGIFHNPGSVSPHTTFFQNFSNFQTPAGPGNSRKMFGRDTNMHGSGGGMPPGHAFLAKGISLFVDEGTPKHVVDVIRSQGYVQFNLSARSLGTWSAREVMPRESVGLKGLDGEGSGDVVSFTGSIPAIRPFSYAFPLSPLEQFRVDLYFPETVQITEAFRVMGGMVGVMVVLHGSIYRGVVG